MTGAGALLMVGVGKMGGAILEGWLASGIPAHNIIALDPHISDEMRNLLSKHNIQLNPPLADIGAVAAILLAVKPQSLEQLLPGLLPLQASKPVTISIVAGKPVALFEHFFGADAAIIRTMPNTPAAIGRGITAMVSNANVTQTQAALATKLLSAIGEVVVLNNEDDIDAVTGVSGSGPAYVFYFIECLATAGVKAGLAPELAMQLARATVAGAGELMRQSGTDAATLRKNVTSPQGTTHAALQILMSDTGLQPLLDTAVAAAAARSRELAK